MKKDESERSRAGGLYRRLGLRPVINAFETVTLYGGSIMPAEVLQAMQDASGWFVDLPELQRRVGRELARLTRNEAAWVTAGAAAGLALSLAACLTGTDPRRAEALPLGPSTEKRRDEVVVHRCQRNPYDRCLLLTGARLVEFGYPTHPAAPEQLEWAITERTAAVFYFAGRIFERYALPLERVVEIAHRRGVPVVVDAAAQLPPPENLWHYTRAGADLALFSGGKGLRGPQDSGLIVGRRELIEAVELNSAPRWSFGRPMKVSRESIAGLLRAVELFLQTDHQAEYRRMVGLLEVLLRELQGTPGITAWLLPRGRHGQLYPRAAVRLEAGAPLDREELIGRLEKGDPSVLVGPLDEDPAAVAVNPFGLQPGEERIVARRIREEVRT